MTGQHVLVVGAIGRLQMDELETRYTLHRLDQAGDPETLLSEVGDRIRVVLTSNGVGFPEDLLARLPNLELVSSQGVGTDGLCVDACRVRGVAVANTPDVLNDDVADMAMMLVLATVRRLVAGDRWVRDGRWEREGMMPLNRCIHGKVLGIAGLGRIGKAIARRAEAFGLEIAYFGRRQQPDVHYRWCDSLEGLARDSDILLLALPGGDATRGVVDEAVLNALGPDGYLINIGRGSVVDEACLVDFLEQGKLAGAGLDVFAHEPRVPEALKAMEQVVLQPHCASGTVETRDAMAQLVADNIVAHFEGRPLLSPV
ncbi:2-hydroxyacid dehydrogenase [Marinobacter halodurans]|uniref:2-hydroxyacid dehydrogenase n=1 Tax=Marinobacter halodurans TaxID=2528979 RepID=A0ABY1ZK32_9GAMM|nr:2-hydroxyacid dehydrogenase [Marinobacter halodurans]TBW55703.1 2-hydroxyacid dehydrogenase [Marinobacter halodurans]